MSANNSRTGQKFNEQANERCQSGNGGAGASEAKDGALPGRVAQANGRLRAGNVGLSIQVRRDRFYLVGTLPAKPEVNRPPHQQWLSTGVRANLANLPAVEKEARRIAVAVADKQFDWSQYIRKSDPDLQEERSLTTGEWIQRFTDYYLSTRPAGRERDQTWKKDYLRVFRELDPDQPLTTELMEQVILTTAAGTRQRERFCNALTMLAKFAKVELEARKYWGKRRGAKGVNPRSLPPDNLISHWYWRLNELAPEWAYVYGLCAAYGLRPNEVWHVDQSSIQVEPGLLRVWDNKRSTFREGIWPLYPEWWSDWKLHDVRLPICNAISDPGAPVSKQFKKHGVPFQPYVLRHAWAGRAALFGLETGSAARMMGHSVRIHEDHYGHWYNEHHSRKVFALMMQRADRPVVDQGI